MSERPWEWQPGPSGTEQPKYPPPAASTGAGFAGRQPETAAVPQPGPVQPPWHGQGVPLGPPGPAATPSPNWPLTIASLIPALGFGCGIVALVLTNQIQPKLQAGDIAGAQIAANNARIWAIIGVVINVLIVLAVASQMPD